MISLSSSISKSLIDDLIALNVADLLLHETVEIKIEGQGTYDLYVSLKRRNLSTIHTSYFYLDAKLQPEVSASRFLTSEVQT